MPRDRRAVIGTAIWNEPSIRALPYAQQHAYFLAYTQPNLNRCGVLPYNPRRWSQLGADLTVKHLRRQYLALHDSRHVVLDEDHEELLIRTYVGHDGLLAQPLVVAALVRDWPEVTSAAVRRGVLRELRRLWDKDTLPDAERSGLLLLLGADPQAVGIAVESDKQAARIRGAMGDALTEPMTTAIAEGSVDPFPKGPREGLPEGLAEGLTDPLVRARSRVSPSPSPSPSPTPTPAPTPDDHSSSGHNSPKLTREPSAL